MRDFADTADPLASLEFAQKCGNEELLGTSFRALVGTDAMAAWDWLDQNPSLATKTFRSRAGAMESLIQAMTPSQMKDLERIAALTPPGELKRQIETKLFTHLVTTDPEAALAEAKATKAPRIAAQRLAAVGKTFIHSDPEKAFKTAEALFSTCPGAADPMIQMTYPGGGETVSDDCSRETYHLLAGLSAKDPARTLEMILPGTPDPEESWTFSFLTDTWAERDLVAYTGWVNAQTNPLVREPAARRVVSRLARKQQYGEALDWAMSLKTPQNSRPDSTYREWRKSNPQAAQAILMRFAQTDPEKVIALLKERPSGWTHFHNNLSREGILDKLCGELANLPPSWRQSIATADWFIWQNREKWWHADLEGSGFTAEQAKKIRLTALERMTHDKPETAIQWIDAIDLSAKERHSMIERIFSWSVRTPEESAKLIQQLTTEEDRRAAQAMLVERAANQETPIPPVADPAEWLEKLAATQPRSNESRQYNNMLRTWEPAKLTELASRLRELPEERRQQVATIIVEQGCDYDSDYQPVLHGEALRCLAANPDASPTIVKTTSTHAVKWAQQNPAAADQWLNSLPKAEQSPVRDFLK